ncbi:hypothetical protein [Shimia sp.]|uniref:hypothetical protein n=1 Tax=Shimia sp. TaxID=1954381 RepID=UPI00356A8613
MSMVFLGKAQLNALRAISRDIFPEMPVRFRSISDDWGSFDEEATRSDLAEADLVVAQAITDPDAVFNTADLMATTTGDVIFLPYLHVDGLASLELDPAQGRVLGAEQLLEGQAGRDQAEIFDDFCRGRIDMGNQARIEASLTRMGELEASVCDLAISGYIAETYHDKRSFFGVDHPAQHVLFELFRRLCAEMALEFDRGVFDDPVFHGRHAMPYGQRAFTPVDVGRLGLAYECDPHWHRQAQKLVTQVVRESQLEEA